MADLAIQTIDVVKIYKEKSPQPVRALDGLSLTVKRGEIFGLLGRNGAGKTTLIRILTTLIQPTSGRAMVAGFEMCVNGIESVVLDMIALVSRSSKVSRFEVSSGTLEDAFVELLGNTQKADV